MNSFSDSSYMKSMSMKVMRLRWLSSFMGSIVALGVFSLVGLGSAETLFGLVSISMLGGSSVCICLAIDVV